MSKPMVPPSGPETVWASRSTVTVALAPRSAPRPASSIRRATSASGSSMVRMAFLKQLDAKMSAKLGAMMQR